MRIQGEGHDRLYPLDRQMLGKAVELFTPAQLEQLRTLFDGSDQ